MRDEKLHVVGADQRICTQKQIIFGHPTRREINYSTI